EGGHRPHNPGSSANLPSLRLGLLTHGGARFCGGAPLLLINRSVPISKKAMAFWRRKKDEEFVSLGLSRAAAEPAPQTQNETATEVPAPVATRESEAMAVRAPLQTFVLGLDFSV